MGMAGCARLFVRNKNTVREAICSQHHRLAELVDQGCGQRSKILWSVWLCFENQVFAAAQRKRVAGKKFAHAGRQGNPPLLFAGVFLCEQGKLPAWGINEDAWPNDLRLRVGKRAEMIEAAHPHLGNHLFVPKPQGSKVIPPAEGFWMPGIPLFMLGENGVNGMDFSVFA